MSFEEPSLCQCYAVRLPLLRHNLRPKTNLRHNQRKMSSEGSLVTWITTSNTPFLYCKYLQIHLKVSILTQTSKQVNVVLLKIAQLNQSFIRSIQISKLLLCVILEQLHLDSKYLNKFIHTYGVQAKCKPNFALCRLWKLQLETRRMEVHQRSPKLKKCCLLLSPGSSFGF